jgi:hypothetical protein
MTYRVVLVDLRSVYLLYVAFSSQIYTCPGELGGSTIHGDAGGDTDSQQHDGLPNSPSSSGGFCQFSSKGLYLEDMSAQH